jgi:hypothetical protein
MDVFAFTIVVPGVMFPKEWQVHPVATSTTLVMLLTQEFHRIEKCGHQL